VTRLSRRLLATGSLVRLSYALGLLVSPEGMSRLGLAAATPGNAYASMTTRAFGALHTNVAVLGLRAAVTGRDARLALRINQGSDLGDLLATLLEWRRGELPVRAAVGSSFVQTAGLAVWTVALHGA
jgi:hypothetical protein